MAAIKKRKLSDWLPIFPMKVKANEKRHSGIWRRPNNIEDGGPLTLGVFTSLKDGGKQEKNSSLNDLFISQQTRHHWTSNKIREV